MGKKPAPVVLRGLSGRQVVEIEREACFLTPMLGGGVHVHSDPQRRHDKTSDMVTPVRGPAVRGMLRFWWRASNSFASVQELREREDDLWGNASRPGRVNLRIQADDLKLARVAVFDMKANQAGKWNARPTKGNAALAYGAFPLQPPGSQLVRQEPGALYEVKGSFRVSCAVRGGTDEAASIERALDLWLAFGGLGGRTRRGFGALGRGRRAQEVEPVDVQALLVQCRGAGVAGAEGLPALGTSRFSVAGRTFPDAGQAHSDCLEALRDFRQKRGWARDEGSGNTPGLSRWPEADHIRRATGDHSHGHEPRHAVEGKAPRGAFGMPIVFHFKDPGDPGDHTLRPAGYERMASPLILRPIALAEHRRVKFAGVALVVADPLTAFGQAELAGTRVSLALTRAEARDIYPLGGNPDVLGAFLEYFAQ